MTQTEFNAMTPDEIRQHTMSALIKKKLKNRCDQCDANDWLLFIDGALMVRQRGGFALPPPFIPVASLVCKNCGFVKLFSLTVVLDIKENK